MNKKFNNLKPAALNHGNLCFKLLYGCCFNVKFCNAGSVLNSGQIASLGVPNKSTISSNCAISDLPGNKGRCPSNSPKT